MALWLVRQYDGEYTLSIGKPKFNPRFGFWCSPNTMELAIPLSQITKELSLKRDGDPVRVKLVKEENQP